MQPPLPQRKPARMRDFDYSSKGRYFITVCTLGKEFILGHIIDGDVCLNQIGEVVDKCISQIGVNHLEVLIPQKAVMPDHVHFIIEIKDTLPADAAYHAASATYSKTCDRSKMLVSKVIQQFKAAATKQARQIISKDLPGLVVDRSAADVGLNDVQLLPWHPLRWQRGYYDRIIRDDDEYQAICEYIRTNPQNGRLQEHSEQVVL